ncbi:MAG: hypothetical protein ACLQBJ_04760 [Bryobacteraceae bacterium]
MFLRLGIVLLALPAGLAAQAIVEYTLGTASVTGIAAAGRRLGQVTGDKLSKIHGATPAPPALLPLTAPAANPSAAASSARASSARASAADPAAALLLAPASPAPSAPAVSYEDPAGIKEGMDYAEIVRRFGPPSMKLASSSAGGETLLYSRAGRDLDFQLRDGKVGAIHHAADSQGTVVLR